MTLNPDLIAKILEAFPSAPIDLDNISWYQGLLAGELWLAKCKECGDFHHPPGPICPRCYCPDLVFDAVSGEGSVELSTVVYLGPETLGIDYLLGHPIVSVQLDAAPGLRITASMVDCEPTKIRNGQRVEHEVRCREDIPVLVFRPALSMEI